MKQIFRFPSFKQVYRSGKRHSIRAYKFFLRRRLMAGSIRRFEEEVNRQPWLTAFFIGREAEAYPLLHTFADRRFGVKQRLQALLADLSGMRQILGPALFARLAGGSILHMAVLSEDGLALCIHRNDISCHEGYWALSLRNNDGKRLYSASWVLLANGAVLITSVQGAQGAEAKEDIKRLTKQLHYLRPQQLLIISLQYFSRIINANALLGISQSHQVKRRFALKRRIHIDYDALWQEHKGYLAPDGYWHLPLQPVRKSLETISSRKRSQYRRRYAMLDSLQEAMEQFLARQQEDK